MFLCILKNNSSKIKLICVPCGIAWGATGVVTPDTKFLGGPKFQNKKIK